MIILAPSMLSADFKVLGEELKTTEEYGAKYIHYDVMDGMFVPNLSFGPGILKSIRPASTMIHDVHLMIEAAYGITLSSDPYNWIKPEYSDETGYVTYVNIDDQLTVKGYEFKLAIGLKSSKFNIHYTPRPEGEAIPSGSSDIVVVEPEYTETPGVWYPNNEPTDIGAVIPEVTEPPYDPSLEGTWTEPSTDWYEQPTWTDSTTSWTDNSYDYNYNSGYDYSYDYNTNYNYGY